MNTKPKSTGSGKTTNSGSETRQRNRSVTVRLNDSEKQTIARQADARRTSLSAYMRNASLAGGDNTASRRKRVSTSEGKQIALVLACLGRLADDLKAFAILFAISEETAPQREKLDALQRQILATRDQCFSSLGRKP